MHKLCSVQPGPPESFREQTLLGDGMQTMLTHTAPGIHHLTHSSSSGQNWTDPGTGKEKLDLVLADSMLQWQPEGVGGEHVSEL